MHFEDLKPQGWGCVTRQTKKLSHVGSVPICYHDNPILPIVQRNVAPYDVWAWHGANHRSRSLISQAAVRPDTHVHTAFYELLFSR